MQSLAQCFIKICERMAEGPSSEILLESLSVKKRSCEDEAYKLKVIECAEKYCNKASGKKFYVGKNCV